MIEEQWYLSPHGISHRKPVVFRIDKKVHENSFVTYLRSPTVVRSAVYAALGLREVSIVSICQLFAKRNQIVTDDQVWTMRTSEIEKFIEFKRNEWKKLKNAEWNGVMLRPEYEVLKKSINRNGVREPVMMMLNRDTAEGVVRAYLGEGNHRVAIAGELGIKSLPVKFIYGK